jgi:hypothetical protein
LEAPGAIRGRFGLTGAAPCGEADGQSVKGAQLRVRSMNFGQRWRTPGLHSIRYAIRLPLAFVVDVLKRELPEYVQDCIRFPDGDPLEAGLRRKSWPEGGQVLDDPDLCALALHWIAHDCLLEWLGGGEPEESPGYVINTVELSERDGEAVRFAGTARLAGQPVQYQDV